MGCIAGEESIEKRQKIDILRLSVEEWKRVETFEKLLDVSTHHIFFILFLRLYTYLNYQTADKAQQKFSSATVPTLFNAVPALEKLYATWEKQSALPEARPFESAINAAMAKVNEYYMKTAESDAHIMAMRTNFCYSCGYILTIHSSTSETKDEVFQEELVCSASERSCDHGREGCKSI